MILFAAFVSFMRNLILYFSAHTHYNNSEKTNGNYETE